MKRRYFETRAFTYARFSWIALIKNERQSISVAELRTARQHHSSSGCSTTMAASFFTPSELAGNNNSSSPNEKATCKDLPELSDASASARALDCRSRDSAATTARSRTRSSASATRETRNCSEALPSPSRREIAWTRAAGELENL